MNYYDSIIYQKKYLRKFLPRLSMEKSYFLYKKDIWTFVPGFSSPCIIFLYWDLGSWKTTLAWRILEVYYWYQPYTSPTYTYYNKYWDNYHFDLYRMKEYEEFVQIWGEEILDNNAGIILIEWPEFLKEHYIPDIEIYINKTDMDDVRELKIKYRTI